MGGLSSAAECESQAPSACSFDGEMGKSVVITKGAKFGHGKEGPLTVVEDKGTFINIGILYDATGKIVDSSGASKKAKRDRKDQEPTAQGAGGGTAAPPTPQPPPGSVVGQPTKKPKPSPVKGTQPTAAPPAPSPSVPSHVAVR